MFLKKTTFVEKKQVQLVIDAEDVLIKYYVAGVCEETRGFAGFSKTFPFPIQGASISFSGKEKIFVNLRENKTRIDVSFPKPILFKKKYSYILSVLPEETFIDKLGNLKIIEVPKIDLSEIILLPKAGKVLFNSAIGKIEIDPNNNYRIIKLRPYIHELQSHLRTSAIRLEWGISPKIRLRFKYKISNRSNNTVSDLKLRTYLPTNTLFQRTFMHNKENLKIEKDKDFNLILKKDLGDLEPNRIYSTEFFVDITPIGNKMITMPNFGKYDSYFNLTRTGRPGEDLIKSSDIWDYQIPEILQLVKALKKNSANISEYIELAFKFVNQKIRYEINSMREISSQALIHRKGDCSEFSDLFVSLLRAGGVPAKIVKGWVIELGDYTLGPHQWSEYFSPVHGWIQSDPTWGFLIGVSCQHICRKREGIITSDYDYGVTYKAINYNYNRPETENKIQIEEEVTVEKVS